MKWLKLVDRCLLFVDGNNQLLLNLLKEAEVELTRKVNILENEISITAGDAIQFYALPDDYKSCIAVLVEGSMLKPMTDDEIFYDNDNELYTGTPSGYLIRGNNIFFSSKPNSGDMIKVVYNSLAEVDIGSQYPIIPEIFQKDLCNYAIALAVAKELPTMYDKFWNAWLVNIEEIKNEMADRELLYNMKEEI